MAKTESDNTKLTKGDQAPDFQLPGIDGESHALEDVAGPEGTLIVFMCNHCPYVQARITDIVKLHEEFGERIGVVGINSNDPDYPGEGMEKMKEFAEERNIRFPYLLDEDQQVARKYGATCTPDPFLFDGEGRLVFHGRITDALEPDDETTEETMKLKIRALLAGEEIDDWFNPSLGCSIKFSD